jgi:hypothetical protein
MMQTYASPDSFTPACDESVLQHLDCLYRSVVVKELCYTPEGRGFETPLGELFQFTKFFRAH